MNRDLVPSSLFEDFLGMNRNWMSPRDRFDVEETESEYQVCVDLPGFDRDEITVECQGNLLNISAEHKEEEKRKRYSRRYYGSFQRSFTLPEGAEGEKVEADFKNGELIVHIPKGRSTKPRQIEIRGEAKH